MCLSVATVKPATYSFADLKEEQSSVDQQARTEIIGSKRAEEDIAPEKT
jgi:hypothetical protein